MTAINFAGVRKWRMKKKQRSIKYSNNEIIEKSLALSPMKMRICMRGNSEMAISLTIHHPKEIIAKRGNDIVQSIKIIIWMVTEKRKAKQ